MPAALTIVASGIFMLPYIGQGLRHASDAIAIMRQPP
jgi:hypothetical protein